MKKELQAEIKSPLSHGFEIEDDGLYTITIKASCKPGWRNQWWLITVINRATYSFYRYTPHIEGADLFYRIYDQFFGKDDLGGKI